MFYGALRVWGSSQLACNLVFAWGGPAFTNSNTHYSNFNQYRKIGNYLRGVLLLIFVGTPNTDPTSDPIHPYTLGFPILRFRGLGLFRSRMPSNLGIKKRAQFEVSDNFLRSLGLNKGKTGPLGGLEVA